MGFYLLYPEQRTKYTFFFLVTIPLIPVVELSIETVWTTI